VVRISILNKWLETYTSNFELHVQPQPSPRPVFLSAIISTLPWR